MKTLFLVVSTLGVLQASATASPGSKATAPQKVRVAAVDKIEAAPEVIATPAVVVAAPAAVVDLADAPVIPDLPADTSSALVPFPQYENGPPAKPAVKKAVAKKAPIARMGANYVLGGRSSSCPNAQDPERIVPKSLARAQVVSVVESHKAELQACVSIAADPKRMNSVELGLTISETGAVTDLALTADIPAGARACISAAVERWNFPAAETTSTLDYAIALRSH